MFVKLKTLFDEMHMRNFLNGSELIKHKLVSMGLRGGVIETYTYIIPCNFLKIHQPSLKKLHPLNYYLIR